MHRLLRTVTPKTRIPSNIRVSVRNATTSTAQARAPVPSSSHTVLPLTQLHGVESQPIDWSFYRAILGEPILATYDALRNQAGYDAPWEVYLSRCDEHGRHFKTVLKRVHTARAQTLKDLVKKTTRRSEQKYLMDCWEALVAKRRVTEGEEPGDASDMFPGGSFEEWKTWSNEAKDPTTVGYVLEKDVLDPSTSSSVFFDFSLTGTSPAWGLSSLLPPNLQDPTSVNWRKVSRRKGKDDAPIIRTIRTPVSSTNKVSYPIASTVMIIDMKTHPVGLKATYTPYFDKEKQELVAIDPKGKRIGPPVPAKELANATPTIGYLLLARLQGLLDLDKLRSEGIRGTANVPFYCYSSNNYYLVHTADTLDLATQIRRGTFFTSYNLGSRKVKGATSVLRLQIGLRRPPYGLVRLLSDEPLAPADLAADFKEKIERDASVAERQLELEQGAPRSGKRGRPKRLTPAVVDPDQEFFLTPHPDHLPDGELRDQRKKENGLELSPNVTVPQLPVFGGSKFRLVPYVSTCGALPSSEKSSEWSIDVSTPNASPEPSTVRSVEASSRNHLDGVTVKHSQSPETLRFWSWDANQDLVVRRGRNMGGSIGYVVAFTAEEVRDRFPLIWNFAKARGHFQGID